MTAAMERAVLTSAIAIATGTAVGASLALAPAARLAPLVVGVPVLVLALVEVARDWSVARASRDAAASTAVPRRREAAVIGWLAALVAATAGAGVVVGVPVWLALYLRVRAGERWRLAVSWAGVLGIILYLVLMVVLRLRLDAGALWSWSR